MTDQPGWAAPGDDVPGASPSAPAPSDAPAPRPMADAAVPPPPSFGTPPPPPPPPPGGQGWGPPSTTVRRIGTIPLRPLGVGEALDATFKLFRAVAVPALLTVMVLFGPAAILTGLGTPSFSNLIADPLDGSQDPFSVFTPLYLLGLLGTIVVGPLLSTSLTWLGIQSDRSPLPSVGETIKRGAGWYFRALGATLLLGLVLIAPLIVVIVFIAVAGASGATPVVVIGVIIAIPLFIAAAILWTALGAIIVPVVVFEGLSGWKAVERSWTLVRRRFWPVVGYVLLAGIVFGLIGFAVSFALQIPAFFPIPGSQIFLGLSAAVNAMVAHPLTAFFALAVYVDLRVRTEGYDVEVRAAELRG